ncbi:polyprenyl synthetase family protein [Streptomyces sp. KM273126]|uniref:polyprenyl synthetase family protein n=1 Tax=Streptomyces sp. KM273126 TaxID=2545247 RepID=UPI00103CBE31|nr:polyprenyl synthetase family protein [Streptomyces sp. KM273126]MBA2809105.1 polyprenyl synthetase family protein [Streptomyces sp. KM273126]
MTIAHVFGRNLRDRALRAHLLAGAEAVEEGLLAAVKSDVPFIAESGRSLLRTGKGWRLRPLLVLLAARFGDPHAPGVAPAAVAAELTHLAALGHDSVRDTEAAARPGPGSGVLGATSVAVLTGDFLFARASQIVADLGPDAVRAQTAAYARMVTGQVLARTGPGEGCDPVAHHVEVAAARTGSLTGASGRLGALASGADARVCDALARYGERLGTALGLTDDVLGAATVDPPPTHPAPRRALRDARRRAHHARSALRDLPDCAAKDTLAGLCDTVTALGPGRDRPGDDSP